MGTATTLHFLSDGALVFQWIPQSETWFGGVTQFTICCSSFSLSESHASLQVVDTLSSVTAVLNLTGVLRQAYTSSGFENSL